MESPTQEELEPFGRQPKRVIVTIEGEDLTDVDYWLHQLVRKAEFKGDLAIPGKVTRTPEGTYKIGFIIYPCAVND